ncbi:MAG: hypothetical protein IJD48_00735 [Clostridia bacterium]|nr:hypothetical protein [Clostridia bacterium]
MLEENILLNSSEDITFPFTNEWKNVYNFVVKTITEANESHLIKMLDDFLDVLIKHGDAQEDIVLKTAMLYFVAKNSSVDYTKLQQKYSSAVNEGVNCLLKSNTNADLENIFANKKYAYLGKIKLADYITILNTNKNGELINKIKIVAQVNNIIKNYKNKTHKKLINILIETKNAIN